MKRSVRRIAYAVGRHPRVANGLRADAGQDEVRQDLVGDGGGAVVGGGGVVVAASEFPPGGGGQAVTVAWVSDRQGGEEEDGEGGFEHLYGC